MLWFLVPLVVTVLIVTYLLLAPFFLEIDSRSGLCRFRFHQWMYAQLVIIDNTIAIDIGILGWHKRIVPGSETKKVKRKKEAVRGKKRGSIPTGIIKAVLKSSKVNQCYVTLDTGNEQWNGLLYPLAWWVSVKTNKPISINFLDRNELVLEIQNNLSRILKVSIVAFFKNKKQKKWKT